MQHHRVGSCCQEPCWTTVQCACGPWFTVRPVAASAQCHTSHTHHVLCMMNRRTFTIGHNYSVRYPNIFRGYLTLSKRSPTAHSGTRPGLCSAPTTCCQWYPARLPACAATAQAPAGAGSGSKHFSLPPLARCKEQFFGDFPHIKYYRRKNGSISHF